MPITASSRLQLVSPIIKIAAMAVLLISSLHYVEATWSAFLSELQTLAATSLRIRVGYVAAWILAWVGFLAAPFVLRAVVRVPVLVIFLTAFALNLVHFNLTGRPLEIQDVGEFWRERRMIGFIPFDYIVLILPNVLIALPILFAFLLPTPRRIALRGIWSLIPVVSIVAVSFVVLKTAGVVSTFPVGMALPTQLGISAAVEYGSNPDIRDVQYYGSINSQFRKIIFIMDESVRGDLTTLGDPAVNTTPFLAQHAGSLANFGVAISAVNCSLQSRYFMRYGVREEVGVEVFKMDEVGPTIWKYAKYAGFKTVYINAWSDGFLGLHSLMTIKEMQSIDENILVTAKQKYDLDGIAAERLREVLKSPDKLFIYVDKIGAHFPYYDSFPAAFDRFPIDEDARTAIQSRDGMRAVYKNAIAWAVDEFFKKVLIDLDLSDTLIIYTSDHGQNLLEGDATKSTISHCTTGAPVPKSEGYVPLIAITSKQPMKRQFQESAARAFGHATHYEIFPTLLYAFGYDERWLATNYPQTLLNVDTHRHRGFVTFWGQRVEVD